MSGEPKSVIIIGAGVAGLTAAARLSKNPEFTVTVLEGADRIGGRVHSIKYEEDKIEMGAQWVHGEKDNSVYALAHPFGILEETRDCRKFGPNALFVTQSGEFLSEALHDKVADIMEKFHVDQESAAEKEPVGHYASRIFWRHNDLDPFHERTDVCWGILDWIHRYQNGIDGSDNWFVPSCRGQVEYCSCDGNPTIPWKSPASYSSLFDLILHGSPKDPEPVESLPHWLNLNKEVTQILYSSCGNKRVKVNCRDNSSYLADHVICTVSLGVLKHHHAALFQPMLPMGKLNAIESLEFGSVDKIFITFEESWWPENCIGFNLIWEDTERVKENWLPSPSDEILLKEHDGVPIWCRALLGMYAVKAQPNTLMSWITGPPARLMETLDPADLKRDLVKVIQKFVGGVFRVPAVTDVTRSNWHTNPLTRGSYSYRSVESEEKDVWAAQLAEPILDHHGSPIICFAGEATHSHYYSTVHGAHDTGIREADRLTNYYEKKRRQEVDDDYPICCTLLAM